MNLGVSYPFAGFLEIGLSVNLRSLGSYLMTAELQDRYVRPRRSTFLIAVTSIALTFTTLGVGPSSWATTAEPVWHSDISAESATRVELANEVKDGDLRLLVVRDDSGKPDVDVVTLSSKTALDYALRAIDSDPSVVALQVDEMISLIDRPEVSAAAFVTPSTPYRQWGYNALRLGEIHNSLTGLGVRVAVIDSGVDRTGPELNEPGRVLDGCDWVISPTNVCQGTGVTDENGHGTHVAGIIAAKRDGLGVTGVSPDAEILPLRVLNADGAGWLSDIAAAIDYAVANNAKVINLSLGGTSDFALIRVAVENAISRGVVVVAAAGNSGLGAAPSYPAAYQGVIAVAATTESSRIATYSNEGNYIDVAAPGSDILSSWPFGSGYARLSGTSMASPQVAGLAALLLDQDVAANSVVDRIKFNVVASSPFTDYTSSRYGSGFINPYAALGCTNVTCAPQNNQSPPVENTSVAPPVVIAVPVMEPAPTPAAPAPAPAPTVVSAPAPVVAIPSIKETLVVKASNKRRLAVTVSAPTGSKTLVQRKVGKKWRTEITATTSQSRTFRVKSVGTYRVVIMAPTERVTSKSIKSRR